MIHPQDAAKTMQEAAQAGRLEQIKKNGCCAFVLLWCLGIDGSDQDAVMTLDGMIKAGVIDSDCTVRWADAVRYLSGRSCSVDFMRINDLSGIRDRTPVRYEYKGKSHWVGVEKGMIAFNPLERSVCVEYGRPVEKRVLKISGGKE